MSLVLPQAMETSPISQAIDRWTLVGLRREAQDREFAQSVALKNMQFQYDEKKRKEDVLGTAAKTLSENKDQNASEFINAGLQYLHQNSGQASPNQLMAMATNIVSRVSEWNGVRKKLEDDEAAFAQWAKSNGLDPLAAATAFRKHAFFRKNEKGEMVPKKLGVDQLDPGTNYAELALNEDAHTLFQGGAMWGIDNISKKFPTHKLTVREYDKRTKNFKESKVSVTAPIYAAYDEATGTVGVKSEVVDGVDFLDRDVYQIMTDGNKLGGAFIRTYADKEFGRLSPEEQKKVIQAGSKAGMNSQAATERWYAAKYLNDVMAPTVEHMNGQSTPTSILYRHEFPKDSSDSKSSKPKYTNVIELSLKALTGDAGTVDFTESFVHDGKTFMDIAPAAPGGGVKLGKDAGKFVHAQRFGVDPDTKTIAVQDADGNWQTYQGAKAKQLLASLATVNGVKFESATADLDRAFSQNGQFALPDDPAGKAALKSQGDKIREEKAKKADIDGMTLWNNGDLDWKAFKNTETGKNLVFKSGRTGTIVGAKKFPERGPYAVKIKVKSGKEEVDVIVTDITKLGSGGNIKLD